MNKENVFIIPVNEDKFDCKKLNALKLKINNDNNIDLLKNISYPALAFFVIHKNKNIKSICLAEIKNFDDDREFLKYKIYHEYLNKMMIDNIVKLSINIINDECYEQSYVIGENCAELKEQFQYILISLKKENSNKNQNVENNKQYKKVKLGEFLDENAERVEPVNSKDDIRSNFQRDYERIVHSQAFKRLVDKAQIFTSSKGDYYRTRMTHTLEVAQIARGIAKALKLNVELTEAIALAHDLGHTPFGHQGERTLDDILKGKIDLINFPCRCTKKFNYFGGFKHNFHGLRVVSYLEEKYSEYFGLNLTYQVMEGILKHTNAKIKNCSSCDNKENCQQNCFELNEILPNDFDVTMLHPDKAYISTLEGQIVRIADEIAQRSHDLDDAIMSGSLSIEELYNYLDNDNTRELHSKLKSQEKIVKESLTEKCYSIPKNLLPKRIISEVITYFINDIINNYKIYQQENNNSFIDKTIIKFSDNAQLVCDYLENIISKKVINNSEVACFDNKASMIVEGLYKAYYNNPKLLYRSTLNRIFREIVAITPNAYHFIISDRKVMAEEINRIKNPKLVENNKELFEEYKEKQKVYVRAITDFIAGMTDSFAINEYNRIYHP